MENTNILKFSIVSMQRLISLCAASVFMVCKISDLSPKFFSFGLQSMDILQTYYSKGVLIDALTSTLCLELSWFLMDNTYAVFNLPRISLYSKGTLLGDTTLK